MADLLITFEDFNIDELNSSGGRGGERYSSGFKFESNDLNGSFNGIREDDRGFQSFFWNDPYRNGEGEYLQIKLPNPTSSSETHYSLEIDSSLVNLKTGETLIFDTSLRIDGVLIDEYSINAKGRDSNPVRLSGVLPSWSNSGDVELEIRAISSSGWVPDTIPLSVDIHSVRWQTGDSFSNGDTEFFATGATSFTDASPTASISLPVSGQSIDIGRSGLSHIFDNNHLSTRTGWSETNIDGVVYETAFSDEQRTWIVEESPARIVIKQVAPLEEETATYTAHASEGTVSPYGPGDWGEETWFIYPDGSVNRYLKVYSPKMSSNPVANFPALERAYDRGVDAVVFETYERILTALDQKYSTPTDFINPMALWTIDSSGNIETIEWEPEPPVGNFSEGVIATVVNTLTDEKPFSIIWGDEIEVTAYRGPQAERDQYDTFTFIDWSRVFPNSRVSTPLEHLTNLNFYEHEENFVSQLFISGIANDDDPLEEVRDMALSWTNAPGVLTNESILYEEFDPLERVFQFSLVDTLRSNQSLEIEFDASIDTPVINPVLKITDWDFEYRPLIDVNGVRLEDPRVGKSGNDVLIWVPIHSNSEVVSIKLSIVSAVEDIERDSLLSRLEASLMIGAAFGSQYIDSLVEIGSSFYQEGQSHAEVASVIVDGGYVENLIGSDTNDWVTYIFRNCFGYSPDADVLNYFSGLLDRGQANKKDFLTQAVHLDSLRQEIDLVGLSELGF